MASDPKAKALQTARRYADGGTPKGDWRSDVDSPAPMDDWTGNPLVVRDGPSTEDILARIPERMSERDLRRIVKARMLDGASSPAADDRLAAHEAWQRDIGEPAALNALGELSGLNAVGRGAENVAKGAAEGDWRRGLGGAGELALGLLPAATALRPASAGLRAALDPLMASPVRSAATVTGLGGTMLPMQVADAQAQAATKIAEYVNKDPRVAKLREELTAARSLKPTLGDPRVEELEARLKETETAIAQASDKNYKSTAARQIALAPLVDKQKAIVADLSKLRDTASQGFEKERGDLVAALERQLAEAERAAGGDYLQNAPFRERNPGAAEAMFWGAGGLAAGLPFAASLKHNLADRYVHQPSIMRQADKVERALVGGTTEPSLIGRMMGEKPATTRPNAAAFERERDTLDRMLQAREARGPSYLGSVLTGAGLMMEGRMLPEEIDAISFPPGHPTREAAAAALINPDYYKAGLTPSLLAGLAAAGTKKVADVLAKGERPGMSRAESMRDMEFATKAPRAAEPSALDALRSMPRSYIVGKAAQLEGRMLNDRANAASMRDAAARERDALAQGRLADDERRLIESEARRRTGEPGGASGLSAAAPPAGPSPSPEVVSSPALPPPKRARAKADDATNESGVKRSAPVDAKQIEKELRALIGRSGDEAVPPVAFVPADPEVILKTPRPGGGWFTRNENGRFRGGAVNGKSRAEPSPIARAIDTARRYANGGRVVVGPLVGETDGRADKLEASVPPGSHVIPADCVAALGSGNNLSGAKALRQRFRHSGAPRRATGGEIPVLLSDGEFVVSPEDVMEMGGGDPEKGHRALDQLILNIRKQNIKTLQSLPGPVKG